MLSSTVAQYNLAHILIQILTDFSFVLINERQMQRQIMVQLFFHRLLSVRCNRNKTRLEPKEKAQNTIKTRVVLMQKNQICAQYYATHNNAVMLFESWHTVFK